jgi:hypothetical protein
MVPPELRALLRNMNSYYTNRIEGQHTRPHEIDQVSFMRQAFSFDSVLPRLEACLAYESKVEK